MNAPTLFDDQLRVRRVDPHTSAAAAESIRPVLGAECARVLESIRDLGTATQWEIRQYLASRGVERDGNCIARRCTDLRDAGLIAETGATRPGRTGRAQTVWTVLS
jgi:hypothetical protein